jgi:Domain of unknown function (DUF4281)
MWVDTLFQFSSILAASAWVLLATSDRWPEAQRIWSAVLVPTFLAIAYAALFPALYVGSAGGFSSLDQVMELLRSDRRIALAAWLHVLAFGLLVGFSIVGAARACGLAPVWRLPALALTSFFGPVGWLFFNMQRWLMSRTINRAQ